MDPTADHTADPTFDHTTDPTGGALTVTVSDAAKLLGLTSEAVRMRVKRGTLASTRIAGTVYVLLDRPNPEPNSPNDRPNEGPNSRPNVSVGGPNGRAFGHPDAGAAALAAKDETIGTLRDQVEHLRRLVETRDHELETRTEEARRKDHLLAAALERIPALEGPRDEPRGPETATDEPGGVEDRESPEKPPGAQERRSWWQRLFSSHSED